ncbi:hypothetical protein ASG76_15895 [Nocardioides sp. Soil774]|uniref:hypothetical protein n=1 Tax=Nocardioides sp. Soil774 TaxID=1736408 RepID=UPI0006FC0679|nr:hypothetical protein [Nocardioides sp. Soil774]KRE92929.1 hypothetical protein ASG76_15895 [Nocardioides sp. Soil774]
MPTKKKHLVGAYGLFWERELVDWNPGPGKQWQMLGAIGSNRGTLKVCDFRKARGIYMLLNDYGPTYVGLARGKQGFGQRLRVHTLPQTKQPKELRHAPKDWTRFSWFAFDDVTPNRDAYDPWVSVDLRDENSRAITVDGAVRELEALLISVLGIKAQNQMRPLQGERWRQVVKEDCYKGGALTKVAPQSLITTPSLAQALVELSHVPRA